MRMIGFRLKIRTAEEFERIEFPSVAVYMEFYSDNMPVIVYDTKDGNDIFWIEYDAFPTKPDAGLYLELILTI